MKPNFSDIIKDNVSIKYNFQINAKYGLPFLRKYSTLKNKHTYIYQRQAVKTYYFQIVISSSLKTHTQYIYFC